MEVISGTVEKSFARETILPFMRYNFQTDIYVTRNDDYRDSFSDLSSRKR